MNYQLPASIWKIIPTCYHRNNGEVENIYTYICKSAVLFQVINSNKILVTYHPETTGNVTSEDS